MAATTHAQPHDLAGTELVRDWSPDSKPKAFVVLVHGLAEHSGRYHAVGEQMATSGLHVRAFDLIGAGGSGGRRWDIEDWSDYHRQIERHVQWALSEGGPVVLMGHSLGGNLSLGYALGEYESPDLLVLSAPALAGGEAWQRALAPVVGRFLPTLAIPNGLDGDQLSRDPAVAERYFADPLVVIKSTARLGSKIFEAIDDLNANLEALDLPTYLIHGGEDTIVPPASSEGLGELPNVERQLLDGLRHETMNEPEGPEVVADIVSWIEENLP